MFWEQYNHEPNVATLRFWYVFIGEVALDEARKAQLPAKRAAGEAALALMDEHLATHDYFVGDRLTLADIALYAYTHVADEGRFDLARYPALVKWLGRVAATPGHVTLDA
jgi:glutathione S-transferase